MKFLDEYRDQKLAEKLVQEIQRTVTRPWVLMEVCGGQTHSIVKYGLIVCCQMKSNSFTVPAVCVTSLEMIDKALAIFARPDVIFCSFGDMLRAAMRSHPLGEKAALIGQVVADHPGMVTMKTWEARPHVVPLIGATRIEHVDSCLRAREIRLDDVDRAALAAKISLVPTPEATTALTPPVTPNGLRQLSPCEGPGEEPEVVLLMGIQGAGKSEFVRQYVEKGCVRLNRDQESSSPEDWSRFRARA